MICTETKVQLQLDSAELNCDIYMKARIKRQLEPSAVSWYPD